MGATSFLLILRGHWLHLEIPTSSFEDASLLLHYEVVLRWNRVAPQSSCRSSDSMAAL